ncbi:3'-5' exonuclease [Botryobacter ruber]|uniref:3'-5' exonuclease n=1 Tax=Botryobacter ruber TaxID=2171629 RepID=UPI000E0CB897|nr:3'-5' exonuclease [Botryobacter ruber]
MNHTSFTAIDFETAQGKRWSICQVGLVRVENGQVTAKINKLVCPPDNFYFSRNTEIHGIGPAHTCNAPTFDAVWHELKPYIQHQTVVAHNGAFDFSCLRHTLDYYQVEQPTYQQQCTYKIFKKGLAQLCREHRIQLNHHDALSDALACAALYQLHLERLSVQ